jgi:DNA-binding GntR family transcriptional regulator
MDGRASPDTGTTLRDMVVERVRASIVSGRTAPGTLFSVPTLAEEIGISTTPVREALLELARNGLVAPVRNRGFRVEATSLDALRDLFAVRELLERFAIATLARQRPTDAPALRQLARANEAAVERDDVPAYIETDRAFHQELVTQASNPLLARLVMECRDAMRLYGIDSSAGRQRQRDSVEEHFRLIELAEAGDEKGAAKLISSHILQWKPIFTEAIRRRGNTLL